jgi:hypothetical protein
VPAGAELDRRKRRHLRTLWGSTNAVGLPSAVSAGPAAILRVFPGFPKSVRWAGHVACVGGKERCIQDFGGET